MTALDNTALNTVRSLNTVVTLTRSQGVSSFDLALPDLPWTNGTTYTIVLDTTGLIISVAIVGTLTVTINGTPVSNGSTYQNS